MSGALDGIRVIDLTQALAGPFCTSLLADYGADVVKIEPPHGDMIRRTGPFASDDPTHDHGNVFQNANRNKRSLVIDLKSPAGRDLVLTLVRDADVLVENFSGGVMDRLGLSYETLADINPRLVYTSIRGFGDRRGGESPYAHWPAFDVVAQAMGGLMSITGESGGAPVRVGSGIGDTVPALFAAFGTMAALFEAQRSGRGQYVDTAMVDGVLAVSEIAVNVYAATGTSPRPMGNQLQGFAPFNTLRAKDGDVALGAPHNPQWVKLCAAMGRPDLVDDERFSSDNARWLHRDQVYAVVGEWVAQYTITELIDLLGGTPRTGPRLGSDLRQPPLRGAGDARRGRKPSHRADHPHHRSGGEADPHSRHHPSPRPPARRTHPRRAPACRRTHRRDRSAHRGARAAGCGGRARRHSHVAPHP